MNWATTDVASPFACSLAEPPNSELQAMLTVPITLCHCRNNLVVFKLIYNYCQQIFLLQEAQGLPGVNLHSFPETVSLTRGEAFEVFSAKAANAARHRWLGAGVAQGEQKHGRAGGQRSCRSQGSFEIIFVNNSQRLPGAFLTFSCASPL